LKQRDNEWRQARLGEVTASRFADVLTEPSTAGVFTIVGRTFRGSARMWDLFSEGQLVWTFSRKSNAEQHKLDAAKEWKKTHWSATAESYLNEKLAELIHCKPADVWKREATDWGMINEPHAFEAAIPVIESTFGEKLSLPENEFAYIHHPTEPGIGCSPDGIIGEDGLIEIKCPFNGAKWIAMGRRGLILPAEHVPQVQGSLWVTGRSWYVFCYFDPRVKASGLDPLLHVRIERDDAYINDLLAPRILAFRDYLTAEYEKLIRKGPF